MPLIHQWVWDSVLGGAIRDVGGSAYAHDGDWCGVSGTDWTNDARSTIWKESGIHTEDPIGAAAVVELPTPIPTPSGFAVSEGVQVGIQINVGNECALKELEAGVAAVIEADFTGCMASDGWSQDLSGTWHYNDIAFQICFGTKLTAWLNDHRVHSPGYDDVKARDDEAFSAELPYDLADIWNFSFFAYFAYDGIYVGGRVWDLIYSSVTSIAEAMAAAFVSEFGPPPGWPSDVVIENFLGSFIGPILDSAFGAARVDYGVVAGDAIATGGGRDTWRGWQIAVTTGNCNLEFYTGKVDGPTVLPLGNAGWQRNPQPCGDDGGPQWTRVGWRVEAPDGWSSGTVSLGYDWEGIWDEFSTYPKDAVVRKWTHYYKSLVNGNTHDPAPLQVVYDPTGGICGDVLQTPDSELYWEIFTPLEVPEPTVTTFVDDCPVYIVSASQAGWLFDTPGFPLGRDTFSVGYHNNLGAGDTQPKDPLNGGIGEVAIWSGPRALGVDRRIGLRFPP